MLYQACLDPFSENSVPLLSVMPVRVITITAMNIVNIMCNFYLYMYLEDKRKESIGMSHTHTAVKNKPHIQGMAQPAPKQHSLNLNYFKLSFKPFLPSSLPFSFLKTLLSLSYAIFYGLS